MAAITSRNDDKINGSCVSAVECCRFPARKKDQFSHFPAPRISYNEAVYEGNYENDQHEMMLMLMTMMLMLMTMMQAS